MPNASVVNDKRPLESKVADSSIGTEWLASALSNSVLINFAVSLTNAKNFGELLGVRFFV